MVSSANKNLELALDKDDYREDQLISIKKPTNLPYYNNTKDFTRADGELELNGMYYKYVKFRIYNDSLEMLCIPNTKKQLLLNKKDAYSNVVFDLQDANKKSIPKGKVFSFIKLLSEYDTQTTWQLSTLDKRVYIINNARYIFPVSALYKGTVEQPPDIVIQYKTV